MASQPLDIRQWFNQSPYAGNYSEMGPQDYQQQYNQYAQGFQPTTQAAIPTALPGQQPGALPLDPFQNVQQAGLYGTNQAQTVYNQGTPQKTTGPMTGQSYNFAQQVANNPWTNYALNTTHQISQQPNPWLQGDQNFDATVDRTLNKVEDRVNSQFGMGGRTGSNIHAQTMTESMGDVAGQMYSDNYFRNAGLYGDDINQKLTAAGMLPEINSGQWRDVLSLNQLGQQQDDLNFSNANQDWNNLDNYARIVATLNGTQPPPVDKASTGDKLMGLAGTLGSAFLMSGGLKPKIPGIG